DWLLRDGEPDVRCVSEATSSYSWDRCAASAAQASWLRSLVQLTSDHASEQAGSRARAPLSRHSDVRTLMSDLPNPASTTAGGRPPSSAPRAGYRSDLGVARLRSQHVAHPRETSPHAVVKALGAVQAQDPVASLWAVGIRTRAATEASVERAIANREIVRT